MLKLGYIINLAHTQNVPWLPRWGFQVNSQNKNKLFLTIFFQDTTRSWCSFCRYYIWSCPKPRLFDVVGQVAVVGVVCVVTVVYEIGEFGIVSVFVVVIV